jgi:sphinganine C4-monooxygenase
VSLLTVEATFHARHHRLYVPYAYGALYNHPFEGFLLDTLGAGIAYKLTSMSTRQGMCFFVCSTFKTVDDHCGYAFPWDPLQHITSNNAGYHDIHHQSWGIKTNFSQPFFTFWDRVLGTRWTGGDVSARYERARIAAQQKVDADTIKAITNSSPLAGDDTAEPNPYRDELSNATLLQKVPLADQQPQPPTGGKAEQQAAGSREQVLEDPNVDGVQVLKEEAQEEKEARSMVRKSNRRRTASSLTQSDSLRGLREKVSAHGRTGGILGMSHSNQ